MAVLMKRREFFQKTALFGIAAYAGLAKDAFPYIYRHLPEAPALPYDLVAVKNGALCKCLTGVLPRSAA